MKTTCPKSVIILGADGYLGWPMCLHLSRPGHRVVAVDNLVRRQWNVEGGSYSLVPIAPMEQRVARWRAETGLEIEWRPMDICDGEPPPASSARSSPRPWSISPSTGRLPSR
ncbi:MAG: UDP-sulfoquinovose synthase, chloroplastic [Actinobacteria bacterium]|nr:UDP-sulfoquinovose synthase, chloroplastic [Actinomycetota bacterium]